MMPNLDEIYDATFFKEWGPTHTRYVESAGVITTVLHERFQPRRLVDLGAGCGVYSHLFRAKGTDVLAIDGVVAPAEHAFNGPVHRQDLTVPFANTWGAFDLALCLEVAEHIPAEFVDPFLRNLLQFSDLLILSAAPPSQSGHHHVNEQPKRYWVERLAKLGFVYQRKETGELMETFKRGKPGYMWMCEHISVYRKTDPAQLNWAGLPFARHR
jgi:hypothetical protein